MHTAIFNNGECKRVLEVIDSVLLGLSFNAGPMKSSIQNRGVVAGKGFVNAIRFLRAVLADDDCDHVLLISESGQHGLLLFLRVILNY